MAKDLGETYTTPLPMYCDNQTAIHITKNPIFHEKTKHIEVDCHFVRMEVLNGQICAPFISSDKQLVDIFTKSLSAAFSDICIKRDMSDIYAPT